jgi:hypothetical protein
MTANGGANHNDLHPCFESRRKGREKPDGQLVINETIRVIRKQYRTLNYSKNNTKPLFMNGLRERECGVLSGRETLQGESLSFDPEVSLRAERTQCEAGPKGRVNPKVGLSGNHINRS